MEGVALHFITDIISGSNWLGLLALIIGGYVFIRRSNIEGATSVGRLHEKQINNLLSQIQTLSEELKEAREELSRIHMQNMQLLVEISDSNIRIRELESMISELSRRYGLDNNFHPARRATDLGKTPRISSENQPYRRRATDRKPDVDE
jgi:hypothetical protein